ncbi:MAG: hypothetical protein DPW14_03640 [Planctomycetes bacterium]|nr:hypothetical protein [Planctomycetota bacterium]RIK61944.1 MAG: hypothetical protein DCC64_11675 [Planctomycetota bacterium]
MSRHVQGIPVHVVGVADGVGSLARGEEASRLVCEALATHLNVLTLEATLGDFTRAFRNALNETSQALDALQSPASTTATAALILPHAAFVASSGDSPCVYYSRKLKRCGLATKEHSTAQDLYARGEIEASDIATHPFRGMLTSYVSKNPVHATRVDTCEVPLDSGDRLLVCSDGLLNILTAREVSRTLALPNLSDAALLLEVLAAERADDNASFVLAGNDHAMPVCLDQLAFAKGESYGCV